MKPSFTIQAWRHQHQAPGERADKSLIRIRHAGFAVMQIGYMDDLSVEPASATSSSDQFAIPPFGNKIIRLATSTARR
ncbi:MAG TPA: hypothetical protein VMS01_10940 [Stellaceae bacterium]|nr:hypothetical protein [Stellaceae bacterium]